MFFFKKDCIFVPKTEKNSMKKASFLTATAVAGMMMACSTSTRHAQVNMAIDEQQNQPGDSTHYGLACDGCTDSILVFLPNSGGDPDTFNILDAVRDRRVFGRPHVGDRVAIVVNREDSAKADIVINLDRLAGQWTYQVMPKLRRRAGMEGVSQQQPPAALPDSVMKKIMVPCEVGFVLNGDGTARPFSTIPRSAFATGSPVEYPRLKHYREWRISNGRLLLTETKLDSLGQSQLVSCDTAQFVLMRRDTLVLSVDGVEQGYKRATPPVSL